MTTVTSTTRATRPRHPRASHTRVRTHVTPTTRLRRSAATPATNTIRRALAPTPSSPAELAALWAMRPSERVDATWRGDLTLAQLTRCSSRRPTEVPLIAGEFAWIIIRTPAWAEADRAAQTTPRAEGTP